MLTLTNLIYDYEFEALGPFYGLMRQELLNGACPPPPWAVHLMRNSNEITSNSGAWFSYSEIVVLAITRNQDMAKLGVPPIENELTHATQLTCLKILTPWALTRSGDFWGNSSGASPALFESVRILTYKLFVVPLLRLHMLIISVLVAILWRSFSHRRTIAVIGCRWIDV
jgi:hypothetical protein